MIMRWLTDYFKTEKVPSVHRQIGIQNSGTIFPSQTCSLSELDGIFTKISHSESRLGWGNPCWLSLFEWPWKCSVVFWKFSESFGSITFDWMPRILGVWFIEGYPLPMTNEIGSFDQYHEHARIQGLKHLRLLVAKYEQMEAISMLELARRNNYSCFIAKLNSISVIWRSLEHGTCSYILFKD